MQTRTRNATVSGSQNYKNPALPFSFMGWKNRQPQDMGAQHSMASMHQDAEELSFVFKPTDVRWRFVAKDKSDVQVFQSADLVILI